LQDLSQKPDTMTVEFGVSFGVKGNMVVASSSVDNNYKITLSWSKVNIVKLSPTSRPVGLVFKTVRETFISYRSSLYSVVLPTFEILKISFGNVLQNKFYIP